MRRALACLLLVALPAASHATTFLYLSSAGPSEPVMFGRRIRLTHASSVFPYPAGGGGLAVTFEEPSFHQSITAYFVPPPGTRFAPGSYDGSADCGFSSRPGVCISSTPTGGHIDVREATYDGAGNLIRFAAEFSQHRASIGSELLGSIRFNVGDATCGGAADGTPCDDLDACSTASSCLRGQCVADTEVTCPGPAGGPCHDAPVCDPSAGTCAPPTLWNDGVSCQPDDQCLYSGYCVQGECASTFAVSCYDGNACTADDCDSKSGCSYAALAGVCGHDGLPTAFAVVRRTPARAGDPAPFASTPAQGMSVTVADDGTVNVQASVPSDLLSIRLIPPPGEALRAGTYENVASFGFPRAPGQAALDLFESSGSGCAAYSSRFVVHELERRFREHDRGQALTFAADFEQRCEPDGPTLAGAIRYRAGDAACVDAADGTACDDRNACTATSTCQAGACRGADAVVCPGPAACHATSVCDPTTGACIDGSPLANGTPCDDPGTCAAGGTCDAGVCTTSEPPCDDGNPCTVDRCAGAGTCAHDARPDCWLVAAKVRLITQASGTLQGQSVQCGPVRCQRAGQGVLLLPGDGTYRAPGSTLTCPSGTFRAPDEVGTARPTRSGKLRLRPTNRTELRQALRRCFGHPVSFASREWVRISESGRELTGMSHTRLTVFDRLPIVETATARLDGRLGVAPPPAVLDPRPAVCVEPVRLQCFAR